MINARKRPGARERDDELSRTRYIFDWTKQFELSLDSQGAKRYQDGTLPADIYNQVEFCSMSCPKNCSMQIKILDEELIKLDLKLNAIPLT